MKPKLFILLYILCICLSTHAQVKKLDITRNVKFAVNLRSWTNKRVDSLLLDIYYPPEATSRKKYPLIVFCHGGSFTSGSRTNIASDCDLLSKEGFAVAAVDYRVGYAADTTQKTCNADTTSLMLAIYRAMQDVNASLRFLQANADMYNLDTANFFLGGTSAGGTLTLFDTYINDSVAKIYFPYAYNALGSLQTSGNNLPATYNVRAICPMWGGLPDYGLITKKSVKPTILFKGGLDQNLPDGSGRFQECENYPLYLAGIGIYNATVAAGAPCVYHFNPYGVHAAYDDWFTSDNVACFFKGLIIGKPYTKYLSYYVPSCP